MSDRYGQAELLVALWRLGSEESLMPTSHGVLDRALEALRGDFPEVLSSLTFSTTGVGRRCFELPDILLAAQEALLTSEPNPTYQATLIKLDEDEAEDIVASVGLTFDEAVKLGKKLAAQVESIRDDDCAGVAA